MTRTEEFSEKRERVRSWLSSARHDAVLFSTTANFSWYTAGGDDHVSIATEFGVAPVLVTPKKDYVITNNIESQRIRAEELAGLDIEVVAYEWHDEGGHDRLVRQLTAHGSVASDRGSLAPRLAELRYSLTPSEIARYRSLGKDVADSLAEACRLVQPRQTEFEAAGIVAKKCLSRNVTPIVLLAAADDRIRHHRHPIPTDTPINERVMLVVCGRRHGLIVSTTRLVNFAPLTDLIKGRHESVCAVDALVNDATTPDASVSEIFGKLQRAYSDTGFGPEWWLHHQGGATGYGARDYKGTPDSKETVQQNQAFAWNPSITGTKSEDTIIATLDGPEYLSTTDDWPTVEIRVNGKTYTCPDILVRDV